MTDHDGARARRGDLGQHGGRALAQRVVGLAAGWTVAVRIGAPVGERGGMGDLDLLPAEAFPRAVAQFGQARIIAPVGGTKTELAADDLRRLAGAAERASEEDRRSGLLRQLTLQRAAHGLGLLPAALGQSGILGALHAP